MRGTWWDSLKTRNSIGGDTGRRCDYHRRSDPRCTNFGRYDISRSRCIGTCTIEVVTTDLLESAIPRVGNESAEHRTTLLSLRFRSFHKLEIFYHIDAIENSQIQDIS